LVKSKDKFQFLFKKFELPVLCSQYNPLQKNCYKK
jgi:hypothetical protein